MKQRHKTEKWPRRDNAERSLARIFHQVSRRWRQRDTQVAEYKVFRLYQTTTEKIFACFHSAIRSHLGAR